MTMIIGIVVVVLVVAVAFIVGLSMRETPKERAYRKNIHVCATPAPSCEIIPPELKAAVQAAEEEAFRKAQMVQEIVEHHTGVIHAAPAPVEEDLLNETAFLQSITKKVEKVKRLSAGE